MSNEINLFETAARKKFRFESVRGKLTAEQLWDLPLLARDGYCLNEVAREISSELKGLGEESFVKTKSNPRKVDLTNKLDLIKYIIDVREKEAEAAELKEAKREKREKLLALRDRKQNEALEGKSLEEIDKEIAELEAD